MRFKLFGVLALMNLSSGIHSALDPAVHSGFVCHQLYDHLAFEALISSTSLPAQPRFGEAPWQVVANSPPQTTQIRVALIATSTVPFAYYLFLDFGSKTLGFPTTKARKRRILELGSPSI